MKKDIVKIAIETVPNGYRLQVNGENFMYLTETDLLAGFISHVGLQKNGAMERGTILSGLFYAMLGDEYAEAVTTLKQRVGLLSTNYELTLQKMEDSIRYVNSAMAQIDGMKKKVEFLKSEVDGLAADHTSNCEEIKKAEAKLKDIDKLNDKVKKALTESSSIIDGLNKAKKEIDQHKSGKDAKEKKADDKKAKESEAIKKQSSSRKKNDEAILKEIEEQAKNNPNLK
jgi:chromosome segregation ATPase